MEALWKSIAFMIKNPDGTHAFSLQVAVEEWTKLYKEMLDFSGKPTENSYFNEIYGLNDMDST